MTELHADAIRGADRCPRCACRKVIRAEFPTERCGRKEMVNGREERNG